MLLEAGGQRSAQAWLVHSLGMATGEAHGRAQLARRLFRGELPAIRDGLESGIPAPCREHPGLPVEGVLTRL